MSGIIATYLYHTEDPRQLRKKSRKIAIGLTIGSWTIYLTYTRTIKTT